MVTVGQTCHKRLEFDLTVKRKKVFQGIENNKNRWLQQKIVTKGVRFSSRLCKSVDIFVGSSDSNDDDDDDDDDAFDSQASTPTSSNENERQQVFVSVELLFCR